MPNEALVVDKARATLIPDLSDTVVIQAAYKRQSFVPHSHPTYVLALITDGALKFRCGREILFAPSGSVCLINPNEVQTGEAAVESGWCYWSAYIPTSVFVGTDGEPGCSSSLPLFMHHVVMDDGVKLALGEFFTVARTLRPSLAQTELLVECLAKVVERSCTKTSPWSGRDASRLVRSAREFMADRFGETIRLDDMARAFGVTGFHLTRAFKKSTGLAMHAWLVQYRVERARALLMKGAPLVETALACGFSDQPHMSRWFRRILGLTPGEIRTMSRTFKMAAASDR